MKPVNPELMSDTDPSVALDASSAAFDKGVEKLFGTKNRNLKRAVADFLSNGTGSLDHHNLRLVAAAGAAFSDVNHVAQLVRQLRPTGLEIAVKSIDLETARAEFATSLPDRYRPETKRNLILDLINRTTFDLLENAPFERVPEQGREIVRGHLKKLIRGTDTDRRSIYVSEFYDRTILDAGLDYLQEQLDRAERENAGQQRVTDLNGARVIFSQVLGRYEGFAASEAQLERAWRLYRRCVPDESSLRGFVHDSRTIAMHGREILEAVERCGVADPRAAALLRHGILNNPASPEDVVRDMIRSAPGSIKPHSRIGLLRSNHYRESSDLMPAPVPSDLDKAVLTLPTDEITHLMASELQTDGALNEIVERSSRLDDYVLSRLITNPNLTSLHLSRLVESFGPELSMSGERHHVVRPYILFERNDIDDGQLSALVQKIAAISPALDRSQSELLMIRAAAHRSSGPAMWEMVERHISAMSEREMSSFLRRIALASASTRVHDALTRISIENHDEGLATDLMTNPILRSANWHLLRDTFPRPEISRAAMMALATGAERLMPEGVELPDVRNVISQGLRGYDRKAVRSVVASGDGSPVGFEAIRDSLSVDAHADVVCDLFDDDGSGDRLVELTGDPDSHLALLAATSSRLVSSDRESKLVLPAVGELQETAHAVRNGMGVFPEDRKLHSWKKLPNRDDEPVEQTDLHELIDGQVIDGLRIEVVKTRRQLKAASEEMRNCLSGYVGVVTRGESIVVLARTEGDIYAAAFEVRQGRAQDWKAGVTVELREVNSKFNEGKVSVEFKADLAVMVQQINNGTLHPVDNTVAAAADRHSDRVRPQRRRAVPPLRTHLDQTPAGETLEQSGHKPPSVLGSTASDVTEQQNVLDVDRPDLAGPPQADPGRADPILDL